MKKFSVAIIIAIGIVGFVFLARFKTKPVTATSAASTPASTVPIPTGATTTGVYKDGSYTGTAIDVGYGTVKVQAIISGGNLSDIKFLKMPSGGHSSEITAMAQPDLLNEALSAQSSKVDIVSGATSTSEGFQQSLAAALSQAS